jgi:hypothetical protein
MAFRKRTLRLELASTKGKKKGYLKSNEKKFLEYVMKALPKKKENSN